MARDQVVLLAAARFVRMPIASVTTGYTVKAMQKKIERGVWVEGHEYVRAPDGHILIDMEGYERWAEGRRRAG